MAIKKIVIYLRKSRGDSEYESIEEILSRHEKQLQEYAIRFLGGKISENNIYREVISGETIDDRPVMKKLLNDIEKGEIEGVLVIEPQRLTRGSFGDIDRIVKTFLYTNTKIFCPTKTYDLNNKFDKKYFEQELLRGNDYLEYTKEILNRGKIRTIEDGYYLGSKPPFGYNKVKIPKKGNLLVANDDAEIVKYIFENYVKGIGTTILAKQLNDLGYESYNNKLWTPSMIKSILKNDVYTGILSYGRRATKKNIVNGEIVKSRPVNDEYIKSKGQHQPIISEELFNKVSDISNSKGSRIRGDKKIQNPLAGIVKCKVCGNSMMRKKGTNSDRCALICQNINCKCVSSNLKYVEDKIIEMLKEELKDYKYYVDNYEEEHNSTLDDINKKIDKLDKKLLSIQNDLLNSLIKYNQNKITEEEYAFLKDYTNKEKYRLEGLKMVLKEQLENDKLDNKRKAIPILEKCLNEYYNLSVKEKNMLLQAILEKVTYYKVLKDGRWNKSTRDDFTLEIFLKI
jgi:DNA invertase Pin-like site-specific DNA recombinase